MKTQRVIATFAILLLTAFTVKAADTGWTTNYKKALEQAKTEHKMVLLDFTGSDWCPWCIKLDKDVYEKPAFKKYAKDHLVLVTVDFPRAKKLPAEVKAQNEKLKEQYPIEGFPTTIILDSNGKKIGEMVGYVPGGPSAFIAKIKSFPTAKK